MDLKTNELIENLMKEHPKETIINALKYLESQSENEMSVLTEKIQIIDEDHS